METASNVATILVADDNSVNLLILSQILRKNGYRVFQAATGMRALEIAEKSPEVELILLDIMMPELNGFDTCIQLKQTESLKDIPVIFLSALDDTASKVKGFEVGAVDYITKPFQEAEILARVGLHLQLRHLELERLRHIQQLRELNQQKDNIMGVVSHDLRSPLGGIRSLAELIRDEDDIEMQEVKHFADVIIRSADQMIYLVNDLLDLAKIESGKMSLDLSSVNLVEILQTSVTSLQPLAREKQITIESQMDEDKITMLGDYSKLTQVFNNLLTNAIKFTPLKGNISVALARIDADMVGLSIRDTGIGISAEMLPHLFEKFGPHQRMGTSGEKGSGLGMPIVKNYIEMHGGSITVESQVGEGTEFLIELPLYNENLLAEEEE